MRCACGRRRPRSTDGTPLWLGSTQTLRATRLLGVATLWLPEPDTGHAHARGARRH